MQWLRERLTTDRSVHAYVTHDFTSVDPYTPSTGYYECVECSYRKTSDDRITACPNCNGDVRNIAVARE